MVRPFVIAIDGPAASGKGTLARRLAAYFSLPHLDTGLTYRAVGKAMLDHGHPLDDEEIAAKIAETLDFANLDRATLSAHGIGEAASKVAVMAKVRAALVAAQRQFARRPPGAVLDGRDIATVVCPDADVKLYITANPEERAKRRHQEITDKGGAAGYREILADLKRRDARDMARKESPLRPAADAHLIDTSEMDIEAAFHEALKIAETAWAARNER